MLALKEFVNFLTHNKTNLALTYTQLLGQRGMEAEQFSGEHRLASARQLLNAVIEAFESEKADPLCRLFDRSVAENRQHGQASDPLVEIESLGQTLSPVVTNLEAGKFLWQILAEARTLILKSERVFTQPLVATPTVPVNGNAGGPPPPANEDRFRLLAEAAFEAIVISEQGKIIEVNDQVKTLFGYEPAEVLGREIWQFVADSSVELVRKIVSSGDDRPYQAKFQRKDGATFEGQVFGRAITYQGRVVRVATIQDISEQKRIEAELIQKEERNRLFNKLIAQTARKVDDQLQEAMALVRQFLGLDIGIISHIKADLYTVKYVDAPEADLQPEQIFNLGDTYCCDTLQADNVLSIHHAGQTEEYKQHPCYVQLQLESYIGAPIWIDEARYGTLNFSSAKPRPVPFSDVDRELVGSMAKWVGSALARKQIDDTLAIRTRAIEASINPTVIADARLPDNPIIYANPAFEQVTGYSVEEIIGKNTRFLHRDDRDQPGLAELRTTLAQGLPCTVQLRNYRKDGTLFWNELRIAPIYDEAGNLVHFIGVQNDITERKQTTEILLKRARELELVAKVSEQAATTRNLAQMLQDVSDLIKERFELYHAHIYLLDQAGDTLTLVAGAGAPGRQMIAQAWRIPFDRADSLVAQAARTCQGVIVNDVRRNPGFLPNPLLPETRSEMAIPMVTAEKVVGVLDVQSDQVGRFTNEDIWIQTILAAQIAVALENSRLIEQTQQSAARAERQAKRLELLNEMAAKLNQATDLDQILGTIAHDTHFIFASERASVALLTEPGDKLELYALRGPEGAIPLGAQIPVQGTAAGLAVLESRLVITRDLTQSDFFDSKELAKQGLRTTINAPLVSSGRVIGAINVGSQHLEAFDLDDQTLLKQTAALLATALENHKLLRRTESRAQRERQARQITDKVRSSRDIETALQIAAQELNHALGGSKAVIELSLEPPAHSEPAQERALARQSAGQPVNSDESLTV